MNYLRHRLNRLLLLLLIATALSAGAADGPMDDTDGDGVVNNSDNCVLVSNASQMDADGDGWGNHCDGDFNNDDIVNVLDLGYLRSVFFTTDPLADLNGDGIVNPIDLGLFKLLFFEPPGPAGFAIWVNPGDGDWEDQTNWFPEIVPPAEAHVTISQPAAITVTFPRLDGDTNVSFPAASITATDDLVVRTGTLSVGVDVTSTANLSITGGRFDIAGDLTVDGVLTLSGGTLANATIQSNATGDPVTPSGTSHTFENVSLVPDLIISDAVRLSATNGLTLLGSDVVLASANSFTDLRFSGIQTLGGTGRILFSGTTDLDDRNRLYSEDNSQTTIASTITIMTDTTGGRIGIDNVLAEIVLQGAVISDLPGHLVRFSGTCTIDGPVTGTGGGELRLDGTWTNLVGNTISITGGVLDLFGDWTNVGTIAATDSTLTIGPLLDGTWINDGAITLTNTPADIGGNYSLAQLTSITTDSPIILLGNFNNSGTDFDVDGFPNGITLVGGGTITGGTISGAGGLPISGTNANFDGVTLATDVTLLSGARLEILNGLTLANIDIVLASTNAFTDLRFDGTQTLAGTGNVRFAGNVVFDDRNRVYPQAAGQVLTIADTITFRTDTTGGQLGLPSAETVFQGSLISDVVGREVRLRGAPFTLEGSITVSEQSSVNLIGNGQFEMTASGAIDLDIGPATHGTLDFDDSAAFAGDLNLALVNGASPAPCDLFTVFTYESFSGGFDFVTGPDFGGGQTFDLFLLENIGQLQVPGVGCSL